MKRVVSLTCTWRVNAYYSRIRHNACNFTRISLIKKARKRVCKNVLITRRKSTGWDDKKRLDSEFNVSFLRTSGRVYELCMVPWRYALWIQTLRYKKKTTTVQRSTCTVCTLNTPLVTLIGCHKSVITTATYKKGLWGKKPLKTENKQLPKARGIVSDLGIMVTTKLLISRPNRV